MRKNSCHLLFLAFLLNTFALLVAFPAQTTRETLTNEKIVELVKLGLSETLIVAKINRSICECDTSTAAITRLKVAKVSDAIIVAMLIISDDQGQSKLRSPANPKPESYSSRAEANVASTVSRTEPASSNDLTLSRLSEPGIYVYDGGEMKTIEPAVFSGTKMNPLMGSLTLGIKK